MTFSEEAAELHRIEAVAMSLGLTETAFERILREVTVEAHAAATEPARTLAAIRERVHQAARRTMPEAGIAALTMVDAVS
jgi:histone H3/H4